MAKPSWFQRAVLGVGATPLTGVKAFTQPPFWELEQFRYPWLASTSLRGDREGIDNDFDGYVGAAYKADGVVFACLTTRQLVFSEARFQWRQLRGGRPGDLFGNDALALLENPWPGGTTGDLLTRMDADVVAAGNFYATTADDAGRLGGSATGAGRRVVRMRPDWVTLVISSRSQDPRSLDARVVGYVYQPPPVGGRREDPVTLLPEEVAHYSPHPDPAAMYRGMSPLTPILTEIEADKAATVHKRQFFANGATPSLAIRFPEGQPPEVMDAFRERFNAAHQGAGNAYKTLFIGGGADPVVIGKDFQQMDLKATQGVSETRIAAALRVHPTIVGLSEGMQGSSLNAGNFASARRGFVDGWARPSWRMAAGSLASLVTAPGGSHLWYDSRDIAFLRDDAKDEAETHGIDARTIRSLVDAGFNPDAVVDAVMARDLSRLKTKHSGLFSVQLQKPGTPEPASSAAAAPPALVPGQPASSSNGNGRVPARTGA